MKKYIFVLLSVLLLIFGGGISSHAAGFTVTDSTARVTDAPENSEMIVALYSGSTLTGVGIYSGSDSIMANYAEDMPEAAQAVHNDKQDNGGIVYISVMNNLSVDCDCDGNPAEPEMDDIGILASYDPVALDQACVDLVYEQKDSDGRALVERIESRNGLHTLEHAAAIGLGSRGYKLVSIDN